MRLTEVKGAGRDRDLQLILQVFDCVVPDGEGSYLAAPISTGRRYYDALAQYGAASFEELIRAMGEEKYLRDVRWPNVEDGEVIAERLRKNGVRYLINTGPLFIREWPGANYMELCFALLEKKVRDVYLHPEWAFSSGAAKEYFFCQERGMRILDTDGQAYTPARALNALGSVRQKLSELHLSTERVEKQLDRLRELNCSVAGS
jgi:Domain of unknown function (DUF4406)